MCHAQLLTKDPYHADSNIKKYQLLQFKLTLNFKLIHSQYKYGAKIWNEYLKIIYERKNLIFMIFSRSHLLVNISQMNYFETLKFKIFGLRSDRVWSFLDLLQKSPNRTFPKKLNGTQL